MYRVFRSDRLTEGRTTFVGDLNTEYEGVMYHAKFLPACLQACGPLSRAMNRARTP